MNIKRRGTIGSVISLASMADIAFLLLVFFVVTSAIGKKQDSGIRPPYARSSEKLTRDLDFTLQMGRDGEVRYNGRRLTPAGLKAVIEARRRRRQEVGRVQFNGDRGAGYGQLSPYLDVLKQNGVREVIFAAVYRKAE